MDRKEERKKGERECGERGTGRRREGGGEEERASQRFFFQTLVHCLNGGRDQVEARKQELYSGV